MLCERCGRENPEGARFCAFCGNIFETKPERRNAAPQAPQRRVARPADEASEPLTQTPVAKRRPRVDGAERPSPRADVAPERRAPRANTVPERKRPIAGSTIVPRRKKTGEDDLFFEQIEMPEETPYDELEEEERGVSRYVKSAIAGLALLVVLWVVFWFLVMPGGQAVRASLGMNAPASAYATLGERYLAEGSVKRAAEAYYNALRLDPNSYEYALAVAKTQEAVGDSQKALAAYAKCISLKETAAEPYQAVASLYAQMGDQARALNALKTGYDKTGSLDLFRAYEAMRTGAQ